VRDLDLSGIDLRGADLAGIRFVGVHLKPARLEGADLTGAALDEADLALDGALRWGSPSRLSLRASTLNGSVSRRRAAASWDAATRGRAAISARVAAISARVAAVHAEARSSRASRVVIAAPTDPIVASRSSTAW